MSANDDLLSSADKRVVGTPMTFETVPDDRWERIFGSKDAQKARLRKAIEEQKKETGRQDACATTAAAVHGDKLYTGWDPCLRVHLRGRTHRKEIMRARNIRCVFE